MINKKAEEGSGLSMSTLITTILLIIGFIILAYFFWQIGFGSRTNVAACHQSVIVRATTPSFAGIQSAAPLKCKTEKICITSKLFGGKCDEFAGTSGITTVRVSTKTDIEKVLTQNLFDCWTMMGEGKASLFSQWFADYYGYGSVYPTCTVCAKIAFDYESLKGINASQIDIDGYMSTHLIPNMNVTYADYLSGQGGAISTEGAFSPSTTGAVVSEGSIPDNTAGAAAAEAQTEQSPEEIVAAQALAKEKEDIGSAATELGRLGTVKTVESKDLDFKADTLGIIFTQVSAPTYGGVLKDMGYTALGFLGLTAAANPSLLTPSSFGSFLKPSEYSTTVVKPAGGQFKLGEFRVHLPAGATRTIVSTIKTNEAWYKRISPSLSGKSKAIVAIGALIIAGGMASTAWNRAKTAGYCGDMSVGGEARDGCSVVRLAKYNATDLNNYCSVIESIP